MARYEKFDETARNYMLRCVSIDELEDSFNKSCDICARRNLCKDCDSCAVKVTFDSLNAIFDDLAKIREAKLSRK